MQNLVKSTMTQTLKKGEVWLANLNPTKGTEAGKIRPVLVLQDQALLDVVHPSTLVAPLTTRLIEDIYPLRVRLNAKDDLKKDSDVLIDQIRAIDNKRFVKGPLITLSIEQLVVVYDAVCEVMGMRS